MAQYVGRRALVIVAALCWPLSGAVAQPADISAMDTLDIKVIEWLPARGEYREWPSLGGAYVVGADLTIAVPFLGDVSVEDLDRRALAARIAAGLQETMSLPQIPSVRIEVASRAPIYVLGAVAAPGAVEFMPGMSVRQAIAMAGGLYRANGAEMRLERDAISSQGALADARDTVARLTAKAARLEAELTVGLDVSGQAPPVASTASRGFAVEEEAIRTIRAQVRQSRIESFESRKALAQDQLTTLAAKQETLARQIELTQAELEDVSNLVARGLAVAGRSTALERTLTDLQSEVLDLDLATLDANLAVNESERGMIDVDTSFRIEASGELQATRTELAAAERQVETALALLREATFTAPSLAFERTGDFTVSMDIYLTGIDGGAPRIVDLDERLSSRDTIEIRIDLDASRDAANNARLGEG